MPDPVREFFIAFAHGAGIILVALLTTINSLLGIRTYELPETPEKNIATLPSSVAGEKEGQKPEETSSEKTRSVPPTHPETTFRSAEQPAAAPVAPTVQASALSPDALNTAAREALVNIICIARKNGAAGSITGSGVIIDPRGVILTNAHIGQYFLLEDYPSKDALNCYVRTGEPARAAYDAKLLYIPPTWIKENAHLIDADKPTGTGENDFALLLADKPAAGAAALPASFPYLPYDTGRELLLPGISVLLASYPAGFLDGNTIQNDLWPVTSPSRIVEVFTFGEGARDIMSFGGNIVAQRGSSGGAAINAGTGNLMGLIVTSSDAATTDERNVNALALAHVDDVLVRDFGTHLASFLSGDLAGQAAVFERTLAPSLRVLLVNALEN